MLWYSVMHASPVGLLGSKSGDHFLEKWLDFQYA
jgi:hypothetical protein